MKSKNKAIKFILLLTLYFSSTLIVLGQQKDSIKFSIDESRALVDAWNTLPKVCEINDSLNSKVGILESQIEACEQLKDSYKEQNKNYQHYSEVISNEIDKQDKELEKANKWRYRWRGLFGLATLTTIGISVIK